MKQLCLYVDKWYIVGSVISDGVPHPLNLPNKEDRAWLFFYEDITSDEVTYGKQFQKRFQNNELHHFGDIFSLIVKSSVTYTKFKLPQPIIGIFKDSHLLSDLLANVADDDFETYVSFSVDINPAARFLFLKELENNRFNVKQSVARIDHLALEYASARNNVREDGNYLVLNASNENLHYTLYQRRDEIFVRQGEEECLIGLGTDSRSRALVEHVVDVINEKEKLLKTTKERETECLRMTSYVDDWIAKLNATKGVVPVKLTNITLSKDFYKTYEVQVKKTKIDERTDRIVKGIVEAITHYVRDNGVSNENLKGVLLIGDTFNNSQFKKEFGTHYSLSDGQFLPYKETNLSEIVSSYLLIDCSQFDNSKVMANGEQELQRLKRLEEDAEREKNAKEDLERREEEDRQKSEMERNFKDAMEKGFDAESKLDYDGMEDYFNIALRLHPGDETAKQKYEEALRKKAEQSVANEKYKEIIQSAKSAKDDGDWETAKQKAEEAIGYKPDSIEAQRIKEEAVRYIKSSKDLERYLDRADLFFAQKSYKDALEELKKAKLLGIEDDSIEERIERIKEEQSETLSKIESLKTKLDSAMEAADFDTALEMCDALIDLDFVNSRKWTARLGDIKFAMQKFETEKVRWNSLIDQIETAFIAEDWPNVVSLCTEALTIQDSEKIQIRLSKAKEKIESISKSRMLDQIVLVIKDLILDGEFGKAKEKLKSVDEQLDDYRKKELYRLIFAKEDEAERAKLTPRNKQSENESACDFFAETDSESKVISAKKKEPKKTNKGGKKEVTLDDFDF